MTSLTSDEKVHSQASPAFRLHIGVYGKVNAGKSTLFNALLGQAAAIVSDTAGSTSDAMRKSCEILGLGSVTFIDTAGEGATLAPLDKSKLLATLSPLDKSKLLATLSTIAEIDGALWVGGGERDSVIFSELTKRKVPIIKVTQDTSRDEVISRLIKTFGEKADAPYTASLCKSGQCVVLVMPQDSQAPKGRLITAQALVIRELLDRGCVSVSSTPATLPAALKALAAPPALVITDSQAVKKVYETLESFYNNEKNCPPLTTFSILMAYQKGDGKKFLEGAKALLSLREGSRVLIAEFCTHTRSSEDIARVKIPLLIKKRVPNIQIDYTSGRDFLTKDLSCYNLVIHCGACMATGSYLRSAQERSSDAQVPMTNYGVAIAALSGVLEKIAFPS